MGNIATDITTKQLQELIYNHMKPKLENVTNQFSFDWSTMVVREVGNWVDLSTEDPQKPYLYERCLVDARGKDNKKVFKKPSRPFVFALVIDAGEWIRYTEFLEEEKVNQTSICCREWYRLILVLWNLQHQLEVANIYSVATTTKPTITTSTTSSRSESPSPTTGNFQDAEKKSAWTRLVRIFVTDFWFWTLNLDIYHSFLTLLLLLKLYMSRLLNGQDQQRA